MDDKDFQTFELPADAFPFTIYVKDRDGVLVDTIRVEEPGVMSIIGDYPPENGPYECEVIYANGRNYDTARNRVGLNEVAISNPAFAEGWLA